MTGTKVQILTLHAGITAAAGLVASRALLFDCCAADADASDQRYSLDLGYWYKSANTDARAHAEPPPPPRRMLVIATTTNGVAMEELEVRECQYLYFCTSKARVCRHSSVPHTTALVEKQTNDVRR